MTPQDGTIGSQLRPVSMTVEPGRLRLFAKATGQTDPVYSDDQAASAAGHPGLVVPPTFLFAIELEQPDPFAWLVEAGINMQDVLHGEQSFTYHRAAHAGETLLASPSITDVYEKKGGELRFFVKHTTISREPDNELIADLESVIVARTASGAEA